jgi:hypothetical protein
VLLRQQIETEIGKSEERIRSNIQDGQDRAFRQLIKQAGKWYFEAIVSAFILFGIWSQTKWTRTTAVRRKKKGSKTPTSLGDIAGTPTLTANADDENSDSQSEERPE